MKEEGSKRVLEVTMRTTATWPSKFFGGRVRVSFENLRVEEERQIERERKCLRVRE